MRHGDGTAGVPLEVWLHDPGLALVHADMDSWLDAHPCSCAPGAAYPAAGVTCLQCGPGCICGLEAQEEEDFTHGADCPCYQEDNDE